MDECSQDNIGHRRIDYKSSLEIHEDVIMSLPNSSTVGGGKANDIYDRMMSIVFPKSNDPPLNLMNEIKIHRHIRIRFYENILLYFSSSWIGFLIPEYFWKKKKKLLKVLNIGKDRIESDLNVVKIMKKREIPSTPKIKLNEEKEP